ncbi:MAG TPA: hypothetical protein VLU99_00660 [Nitrososphaerales archaeon]|nr:hypothetical protein [Nitrososphaerales archaeon]HUK74270.1 hypothetical protein [Nitrososphaerales archaeon]
MSDSSEMRLIQRLVQEIEHLKLGLDPEVLAAWYRKVEADAKARARPDLRDSIQVIRDPILTMKFEFKTSRRAVDDVLKAIDANLGAMPLATRLYFQKLGELIQAQSMA